MSTTTAEKTSVKLRGFAEARRRVQRALADIAEVARELEATEAAAIVESASAGLNNTAFRLVVVGEFSNGKSTVVNALLGDKVLPSSVYPTTAVLSVITNADVPTYELVATDGSRRLVDRERFASLVAPREPDPADPADVARYEKQVREVRNVDRANIGYPSALCSEGVELVDTPGTNDLDPMRERITYEFIPEADAVICVLHGAQILSRKEMELITDRILASDVGKLFFVVTYKDFLKAEEDQRKVVDYVVRHVRDKVADPRVYLVCPKDALAHRTGVSGKKVPMPLVETGFEELEASIAHFLLNDRAATKLHRPAKVGLRVASDLISGPIALRLSAARLSVDEVERRVRALAPELERARGEQVQTMAALRSALEVEGQSFSNELRKELNSTVHKGVSILDGYQGDLTSEAIAHAIEATYGPAQSQVVDSAQRSLRSRLQEVCSIYQRRMEASWQSVLSKAAEEFGQTSSVGELSLTKLDDDSVGFAIGGGLGALGLVALAGLAFPIAIVAGVLGFIFGGASAEDRRRKKILGELKPQVMERLEEGAERIFEAFSAEWRRATDNATSAFERAFEARLEALECQLRELSKERAAQAKRADEEEAWCNDLAESLTMARRDLEGSPCL